MEKKQRKVILDELVRLGSSSADDEVLKMAGATPARMVEVAVTAALDALESNGLIEFKAKLGEPYEYRVQARGGPPA